MQKTSIHAPQKRSDRICDSCDKGANILQSTLPKRGATWYGVADPAIWQHFNPRSPKEERQLHIVDQLYYTQQTELFHKLRQLISPVYINMIN